MENSIVTDISILEVTDNFGGYTAIKKCLVCNDKLVFTGTCKDQSSAINAVNAKFDPLHLDCAFSSASESSAV